MVFCPVILLLIPNDLLFAQGTVDAGFMLGVRIVFWIVYAGIVVYTALLFMGIIAWPEAVARFIKRLLAGAYCADGEEAPTKWPTIW